MSGATGEAGGETRGKQPPSAPPVVRTEAGAVRGAVTRVTVPGRAERTVSVFHGVPYMAPPVGPLRFASPRPHPPWSGIRPADTVRPAFVQPSGPAPAAAPVRVAESAEDAVHANVWTPDVHGRRPVFVYVHGGGWQHGTASSPTYDGARLAARGDLVIVTFNYRLGPLGFGLHEALTDPVTGLHANWGLQDQAALVEWVRSSIAAFGGDPDNITLCGTSAGGAAVWQLALLPRLRGAIRRIVPISTAHLRTPAFALTPDDARAAFAAVARRLGVDVPGLRTVDAVKLLAVWGEYFAAVPDGHPVESGRCYRGPVVDGALVPAYDTHRPVPCLPTLNMVTATEGSFHTAGGRPHPVDDAELRALVRAHLLIDGPEVPRGLVDDVIGHYRTLAAADGRPVDPLSLLTEIHGDSTFRHRIVRMAERGARETQVPQYLLYFDYAVHPPGFGTPHEATSPFLFGTHGIAEHREAFGDGPWEREVSATLMDLVAAFAHDDAPRAEGVPPWPRFTPGAPSTLLLGGREGPRVGDLPKAAELRFWDTVRQGDAL
ncbi:carboxylesterase family protein [Streptomyces spectabilis]|uniref:Carboxylic ester hydrolase n=1 Tax=Streptomyces spectabilis TaxID=68270 RepID=A0A516RDD0_STRST|nr:carboxylesterase family protein [Streptomyces spectabilis]